MSSDTVNDLIRSQEKNDVDSDNNGGGHNGNTENLSKNQRKKLMRHQKWEEERNLRKQKRKEKRQKRSLKRQAHGEEVRPS
ncbi:hypothetical protein UPYG_G00240580 [Umbra pygmaea]|uniref:Uncharacterized protein n=1 Tax=Umbra pygmaea TaxID=75934 RepID=A0ABD0WF84_UMBPY